MEVQGGTIFYMYAADYSEKESWIGALGKAMIKPSVMIDDNFDNEYMWINKDYRLQGKVMLIFHQYMQSYKLSLITHS